MNSAPMMAPEIVATPPIRIIAMYWIDSSSPNALGSNTPTTA